MLTTEYNRLFYRIKSQDLGLSEDERQLLLAVLTDYKEDDLHRATVTRLIEEEPELPGKPPPDLLRLMRRVCRSRSPEDFAEILRAAVRSTKNSLLERVLSYKGK